MNSVAMSRSEKFHKVMKPKINKCLEYWMHCIIDSMEQEGIHFPKAKRNPVPHLKKVRSTSRESFRKGYVSAANEVSMTLAFLPSVDISIGKKIMTHLGQHLNQVIEESNGRQSPSPDSSGYGSDDSNSN